MVYIVLFVIFLITSICTCSVFIAVYFHWYLKKHKHIKNRTYYFYNDLINIKNFDSSMLKLDKETMLNHDVYYISYVTKKNRIWY